MADATMQRLPLGRLAAALEVIAMTVVPVVSCASGVGMKIEFKGHELLRNRTPDLPDADSLGSNRPLPTEDRPAMPSLKSEKTSKTLFEGDDSWLHWIYIAATACAVL